MAEDIIGGKAAEVIRDLASKAEEIQTMPLEDGAILLVKGAEGAFHIRDLERYQDRPRRVREAITIHDEASFIEYVNTFKQETSRIFFDGLTPVNGSPAMRFVAVLDYSEGKRWEKEQVTGVDLRPSWGEHVVSFQLRLAQEWITWKGADRKKFSQAEFAEFIEENRDDVVVPSGADMLELIQAFDTSRSGTFRSQMRLSDGNMRLEYTDETKADNMEVPTSLRISIPIFYGQAPRPIDLRFRYRVDSGSLVVICLFTRAYRILEEAVADAVSAIRTGTSLPVSLGVRGDLTKKPF